MLSSGISLQDAEGDINDLWTNLSEKAMTAFHFMEPTSMSCWNVSSTWLRMLGVSLTKSLIASMWLKEMRRMSFGRGQRSTWYLNAMVIKS